MQYCTFCGAEIADEKRLGRRSPYCSDDCKRKANSEARASKKRCRLCGRGLTSAVRERRVRRKLAAIIEQMHGGGIAEFEVEAALAESRALDDYARERARKESSADPEACAAAAHAIMGSLEEKPTA